MKRFLTMCAGILLICQFTPPLTLAQNAGYEVKGVVVDKSGMPILGATVVEKGTTNGVSTGIDGDYAIRAAGPESVIEVSYVGYKTVSLVASSSLLAHLTLEEDAMGIDDVVVMGETARQIREQLEEAGCTVIYGFEAYKIHSKLTLITKKKGNQLHYIAQIGTGK